MGQHVEQVTFLRIDDLLHLAKLRSATVAEPVESYFAADEKALLRSYRAIAVVADRKLALNVVKRLAKK